MGLLQEPPLSGRLANPQALAVAAAAAPTGSEVTGTITNIDGSNIVVRTRSGETQVDASAALQAGKSSPLVVGKPFTVIGTIAGSGVLRADTIMRAVTNPTQWPADH
jgi:hypothetical protein